MAGGVVLEAAVLDGVLEDRVQDGVDLVGVAAREAALLDERVAPLLDARDADRLDP